MKKKIIIISIVVVIILILTGILVFKILKDKPVQVQEPVENVAENEVVEPVVEEKEIKIYKGDDRPYAVMIDNHSGAWPQAGLNKAYMVYEIIVEGGETRLMPVFKGVKLSEIGPVMGTYASEGAVLIAYL